MIKVFQTIVDNKRGNCMQAVVASLFEKKLEEIPNFVEYKDWFKEFFRIIKENGADFDGTLYNNFDGNIVREMRFEEIKNMPGIDGIFYASVYSPKYYVPEKPHYEQVTHAVLIDKDFNIVHDPNPEYAGLEKYSEHEKLGYNGILTVYMINRKS